MMPDMNVRKEVEQRKRKDDKRSFNNQIKMIGISEIEAMIGELVKQRNYLKM